MTDRKVAIITGGAAGMGFAVAQRLVANGWHVTILDVNETVGAQAIETLGGKSTFYKVDVTVYEQQQAAFEEIFRAHKAIDFVYANAGIAGKADFYDEASEWPPKAPSMIVEDINFKGITYTSHLAMQYMRRNLRPGGVITMTASASSLYAAPDLPLYCASKHGVLGLMRSMAINLQKEGIRVNCVLPGAIHTTLYSEETWSQFDRRDFTPVNQVVKAVQQLLDDPSACGQALEVSASSIVDRKQPDYLDDTMRRIMSEPSY